MFLRVKFQIDFIIKQTCPNLWNSPVKAFDNNCKLYVSFIVLKFKETSAGKTERYHRLFGKIFSVSNVFNYNKQAQERHASYQANEQAVPSETSVDAPDENPSGMIT